MFRNVKSSIILIASLFIGSLIFTKLLPDFFWFQSFNYENIWLFRIKAEWITFLAFFSVAALFLYTNISFANRKSKELSSTAHYTFNTPFKALNIFLEQIRNNKNARQQESVPEAAFNWLLRIGTLILAAFFGLSAKVWWEEAYLYLNQSPYGMTDPLFMKDISFYIFSLPFFNHIQNWLLGLLIVSMIAVGWIYFSRNILLVIFSKNNEFGAIKRHFILLLSLTFVLFSYDTWLSIYELVYSDNGVVFGAAYTDINIILPVKKILVALFAVEAVLVLFLLRNATFALPYIMFALIILTNIVGLRVIPNAVQSFLVSPNELVKEQPYIEQNIQYTREAYQLTNITTKDFAANYDLDMNDIKNNDTIIDNIRLWNKEPLKQTFSQLQEIRLYYEFHNVDVDRYMINGKPQQVMLSARELDVQDLTSQAQTWTNRHLVYTHGYGACMTPVNEITEDGLPEFFIKDLPPQSSVNVDITRPEIYFGEKTNNYVIVNSKQPEFDYPKGDSNVYTNYQGKGGIHLNSLIKRALFALKLNDMKLLVSSQITNDSRLMYDRNINTMVRKIAPFLSFDQDPYLVITESGRFKWMFDAYTFSKQFPYSEPFQGRINYIRNAAKIIVDAFDGTVEFYINDPSDPIINAYAKVYDGLFKPMSDMPQDLKNHLRYPKDLFRVQSVMFSTYHMTDPQVFYNREDLWDLPSETYGESEKTMSPYYLITRLPGDDKESFVLMLPFTPTNKNNMIAWIAVKCDSDSYGEFTVLKLPKERTIYGPMQIESRIDQDTEISKDLTLWGQIGSRVIRGNLMIIPVEESLLYVEPIYLQATQSKLPELKRVIVAYEDRIAMQSTLDESIHNIFGDGSTYVKTDAVIKSVEEAGRSTIESVKTIFNAVKTSLQNAKWERFGKKMEELETAIEQLTE